MRMYGRLGLHAESVVLPLLAADAPVVAWWHAAPPDRLATDALGRVRRPADHRQLDPRGLRSPRCSTRAEDFAPGDTDLAWTRMHVVAGDPRLHRSTRSSGRRGEPVQVTRRAHRGRPGERERPAAGRLAVVAAAAADRRRGGRPRPGGQRGGLRRPPAGPEGGGPDPGRPARRRRRSPSRSAPTRPSRSPTARSATCSARSCAGWTATSRTRRRWRRRPA